MATLFMTGFPGFLGSELLPRLLARHDKETTATCLVQSKFLDLAWRRVEELDAASPELKGRVRLVEGDITRPGLGLASTVELAKEVTGIWHLAAVYDLAVARDLAMRVNVDGTRNMLDFAAACPSLKRFDYVSTCYVSGTTPGIFREQDLERGQSFNNFYEETKYLAEIEVRRRMRDGMPIAVYRPSIVVGDSDTGATQKFDGPYYVLQWLLRQLRFALMPVVGDPDRTCVNAVPSDFVTRAVAHLSGLKQSIGKTYQVCDPRPLTVRQMLDAMGRATERELIKIPLPAVVAKNAITRVPGVFDLMKIPAEAIDYFVHPTHYTCENTLADLKGSDIECPAFDSYVHKLVAYMKAHPEVGSAAMT